ncbi:hypothetical protein ACMFMG_003718 [Clarireedia jacksonii]
MFPDDFDGILAGAPAWWTIHLQLWNMIVGIWDAPSNSSHYIPQSMFNFLADEVIKQCDAQGSVKDRIVMKPQSCTFILEKILCAQHMLGLGSNWTYHDRNPDVIALSDKINSGNATADNFDLSRFYSKGGMNAPWVIGGDGQASGLSKTSHGVPGFQDAKHDVLAMMVWVENDIALTYIIATKYADNKNSAGGVLRQRPICVYPGHVVYDGTSDINAPESWSCQSLY